MKIYLYIDINFFQRIKIFCTNSTKNNRHTTPRVAALASLGYGVAITVGMRATAALPFAKEGSAAVAIATAAKRQAMSGHRKFHRSSFVPHHLDR